MFYLKKSSALVTVFLIAGFLFLALPEKGHAGFIMPGGPPCCEVFENQTELLACVGGEDAAAICAGIGALSICDNADVDCEFFENRECVVERVGERTIGICVGEEPDITRNIPTLSEWGLIALAVAFGIIGFILLRRRKATT